MPRGRQSSASARSGGRSKSSSSRGGGNRKKSARRDDKVDDEVEFEETTNARDDDSNDEGDGHGHGGDSALQFSQVEPEMSQSIPSAKSTENDRFESMNRDNQEKIVLTLTRLLLFKGLAGEVLDRKKCFDEIGEDLGTLLDSVNRTSAKNVAFDRAQRRLRDVFGFEIRGVPDNLRDSLPKKYAERYYLINPLPDGDEARRLHGINGGAARERAVLMIVLAMAYCRGSPRHGKGGEGGAAGVRWITDEALYRLLHSVDEHISEDPPPASAGGKSGATGTARRDAATREVDEMIHRFVHVDYLLKEKVGQDGPAPAGGGGENASFMYAMGPRSAIEIGKKQIIYFVAEMMDEQPDPTMLAEIEDEEGGDEQEEEDEGEDQ